MIFHFFILRTATYKTISGATMFLYMILPVLLLVTIFTSHLNLSVYGAGIGELKVRSVDTMKFSKDIARDEAENEAFDEVIEKQISQIASLNTSHVAIATAYDEEFVPYLRRWVSVARKYKLKVWFRGNLSGWEGWFDYDEIDPETRIRLIKEFISENKDLFEDGDIFTSCPECENGALGYPVGDEIPPYRKFTIAEYQAVKESFRVIGKNVQANFNSMNGELARHLMDEETTRSMDGIVTIDHYVHSQEKLINDINNLASNSGGRIVLGEIGAPIPDIHGSMTELDQREWLAVLFAKLNKLDNLEGINYWVSYGGSTPLWNPDGKERLAAEVVRNAYSGRMLRARLVDKKGKVITDAEVSTLSENYIVDSEGVFSVPYLYEGQEVEISARGYPSRAKVTISENSSHEIALDIETSRSEPGISLWDRIWKGITYPITAIFYLLTGKKI